MSLPDVQAVAQRLQFQRWRLLVLLLLLIGLFFISLFLGRYPSTGILSWATIQQDELAQRLVFNLRLPRLLTALLLGMSLSAGGMVFQMLFANPLVEPGFLGVSQGAAFGAAFSIVLLGGGSALVQFSAAFFALAGLGFSYFLARRIRYGGWVLRLVFAGIAISALYSAGLGILKYLADPLSQLPEITFWLLGGLSSITWQDFLSILPAAAIGLMALFLLRWRLNVLSLNEAVAFSVGTSPRRERLWLLAAAILPIAAVTSVAGMVGWIGLIMPHIARRLFGTDTRFNLPASMLLGGIFAVVCDDIARILLAGEIPLGILTSLLGVGAFILLMVFRGVRIER